MDVRIAPANTETLKQHLKTDNVKMSGKLCSNMTRPSSTYSYKMTVNEKLLTTEEKRQCAKANIISQLLSEWTQPEPFHEYQRLVAAANRACSSSGNCFIDNYKKAMSSRFGSNWEELMFAQKNKQSDINTMPVRKVIAIVVTRPGQSTTSITPSKPRTIAKRPANNVALHNSKHTKVFRYIL